MSSFPFDPSLFTWKLWVHTCVCVRVCVCLCACCAHVCMYMPCTYMYTLTTYLVSSKIRTPEESHLRAGTLALVAQSLKLSLSAVGVVPPWVSLSSWSSSTLDVSHCRGSLTPRCCSVHRTRCPSSPNLATGAPKLPGELLVPSPQ